MRRDLIGGLPVCSESCCGHGPALIRGPVRSALALISLSEYQTFCFSLFVLVGLGELGDSRRVTYNTVWVSLAFGLCFLSGDIRLIFRAVQIYGL